MAYIYGSVTNCTVANGQTRSEYECRLGYKVNSQSIENNTSNITLRLEVRSINSAYKTYGYNQTTIIDGTSLSATSFDMRDTNTWQVFGERTITINHNADGTCSILKSASFTTTTSSGYSLKSGSASVTVAPATIPRASQPTLSATSIDIGSVVTIYMNRVSTGFTHTIRYVWGNKSGTIATGVIDNCFWTLPMDFCDNIPNANSGIGTIYVDTYSGSTLVGTKNVGFTGLVPNSVVPSISSVSISEGSATVPESWGVFVKGKSSLKVAISASGSYSSTIKSYTITGIDNITYYSSSFTSGILQNSGIRTATVKVVDTRERPVYKDITYTCIDYSNPSISTATVKRCNADGTENEEGTSVKYSFKGTIASIEGKNTKEFKIGYKKTTENDYTYISLDNSNYELDVTDVIINDVTFSEDYSYDFRFLVKDYFTEVDKIQQIPTGFTLMDFNASGKGMAIGKVSEKDALEINMDIYDKNGNLIVGNKGHALIYKNYETENQIITTEQLINNMGGIFTTNGGDILVDVSLMLSVVNGSAFISVVIDGVGYEIGVISQTGNIIPVNIKSILTNIGKGNHNAYLAVRPNVNVIVEIMAYQSKYMLLQEL